MHLLTRVLTIITILATASLTISGQQWTQIRDGDLQSRNLERQIIPDAYTTYALELSSMEALLASTSTEPTHRSERTVHIKLPLADGAMATYQVRRTDVLHPNLGQRYPSIQAYSGHNIDNPAETVKISVSPKGIDALILGHESGTVYIDAYAKGDTEHYISYYKEDYGKLDRHAFECEVEHPHDDQKPNEGGSRWGDCTLRTYRLALACTGEYAAFHGGTVQSVLAEYNTAMNRVNGIYERDAAITMQLIENTDELIFFNASSDPYTNDDGGTMLTQNQNTIDQVIGLNNYDIGHVFSTGGGGIASLRSPCTNRRARGVTGLGSPINDPFYVDYVAHEMGHQFGGNHTQNNNCQRSNNTSVEPGSGATIMGYAGICNPNVQNNSDDYFHTINLEEIANFVVAGNGGCAVETMLNNSPPSFTTEIPDFTIPGGTAFKLETSGTDSDSADVLTYTFEQMDTEAAAMPPESDSPNGPTFRSLSPSTDNFRYFPEFTTVLAGSTSSLWEVVPTVDRTMDFTITIRDNAVGGGCTEVDELTVTVDGDSGPFAVLDPTPLEWGAGSTETVKWDVAGSDSAPVSCELVDIYLDTGDETFATLLADSVENDGEHDLVIPNVLTDEARLMIVCSTAPFYAINPTPFAIVPPYFITIDDSKVVSCPGSESTIAVNVDIENSNIGEVTLSVSGLPATIETSLSPAAVTESGIVTLTLSNISADDIGNYDMMITGMTANYTVVESIPYTVAVEENISVSNVSPTEGSRGQSIFTTLSWNTIAGNDGYLLQVSESPAFDNLLVDKLTSSTSYNLPQLAENGVYYWRAIAASPCLMPAFETYYTFQVGELACDIIPGESYTESVVEGIGMFTSTVSVPQGLAVDLINVNMDMQHTLIGVLAANIINPAGDATSLFNRIGVPASSFGCTRPNIRVRLSDSAPNTYDDLEMTCDGDSDYAVDGEFMPRESLQKAIQGQTDGDWTLQVIDTFTVPGTVLNSWSLEACVAQSKAPAVVIRNDGLALVDVSSTLFSTMELEMESGDDANTIYTIVSTPQHGTVQTGDPADGAFTDLKNGDTFTQAQLASVSMRYVFQGTDQTADSFTIDVVDDLGRWYDGLVVPISIDINELSASVMVTQELRCFADVNGSISLSAISGLPPYEYSLDDDLYQQSNVFADLLAGMYTGYVRDAAGSVASVDFSLAEPDELISSISIDKSIVTVTASGGTGQLTYSADGLLYQESNVFDLPNDTDYLITVRDERACEISTNIRVSYIEAADAAVTPVTCFGETDGSITVTDVVGGAQPYTYQLEEGAEQSAPEFTGLAAATYQITVRAADGFVFELSETVTTPDQLIASVDTLGSEATIVVSGGVPPYTYEVTGIGVQEEPLYSDLANGTYTGIVTDAAGCTVDYAFSIENSTVSTSDIAGLPVVIYPNPTQGQLTIATSAEVSTIEIHRMDGQLVSKMSYRPIVDMEQLPPGVYTLTLRTDKASTSVLVVKTGGK